MRSAFSLRRELARFRRNGFIRTKIGIYEVAMFKKLIGSKAFYKMVFMIALPMIIQNTITNFVNLLDNIMVGQLGTAQMSGVSVVNQLIFIFNLAVFGISSGAGVFTSQFFGCQDMDGVRQTMRYRLIASLAVSGLFIGAVVLWQDTLIGLFLKAEAPADAAQYLRYGKEYLAIMLWGLPAFALSSAYAGTLREGKQTVLPMISGLIAVGVNLMFNYILIFGRFGAPALGARGAAIATVISRYVELAIVVLWTHLNPKKCPYGPRLYKNLYIPAPLLKKLILKGIPLMCNEILWSFAITFMNQRYALCGPGVLAALNITSVINLLSNVVTLTLGSTAGIILGQLMGACRPAREIREESRRLIFLSFLSGTVFGLLLVAAAPLFPRLYNTTDEIRQIATGMIFILALFKPTLGLVHACYNTIRSGGKTFLTFLNDSGFMWFVSVPLAFCLTAFTDLSILPIYFLCQTPELLKLVMSFFILRGNGWMQNLTK